MRKERNSEKWSGYEPPRSQQERTSTEDRPLRIWDKFTMLWALVCCGICLYQIFGPYLQQVGINVATLNPELVSDSNEIAGLWAGFTFTAIGCIIAGFLVPIIATRKRWKILSYLPAIPLLLAGAIIVASMAIGIPNPNSDLVVIMYPYYGQVVPLWIFAAISFILPFIAAFRFLPF